MLCLVHLHNKQEDDHRLSQNTLNLVRYLIKFVERAILSTNFLYFCLIQQTQLSVMNNNFCLILAGGIGQRLWPVSRSYKPKQFLDLFGAGQTLLQQTYNRVARIVAPENIYISTNLQYLPLIYEQLPQVDDMHILEEPIRRGTLASVAWGMAMIMKRNPQGRVLVSPSDQLILNEEQFERDVKDAMDFVGEEGSLLVMGVNATRPETGYGYIQKGETLSTKGISRVKTFSEKPARDFAEMFVKDGDFLWNTGLHVFRPDIFLEAVCRMVPEYQMGIPRMMADAESEDPKLVPEVFQMLPNLSLAVGVLERADNVCVKECSFGWADMGTWTSLHDDLPSDADGNVLLNTKALLYDAKDNIIRLPQGRTLVMKGLNHYVVAEEGDILMICPKEDAASMRRMHTDIKFM